MFQSCGTGLSFAFCIQIRATFDIIVVFGRIANCTSCVNVHKIVNSHLIVSSIDGVTSTQGSVSMPYTISVSAMYSLMQHYGLEYDSHSEWNSSQRPSMKRASTQTENHSILCRQIGLLKNQR